MPSKIDKLVRKRGGVIRWRMLHLHNGELYRCAITRRKGPKGGKTVCYPIR